MTIALQHPIYNDMMMTSLWNVMMTEVAGSPDASLWLLHQPSLGSGRLRVTEMRSLTN